MKRKVSTKIIIWYVGRVEEYFAHNFRRNGHRRLSSRFLFFSSSPVPSEQSKLSEVSLQLDITQYAAPASSAAAKYPFSRGCDTWKLEPKSRPESITHCWIYEYAVETR